jgi:hypothetical protein
MKSKPLKRPAQAITEHTQVVLKRSLPSLGLPAATFGVIVHVYDNGAAYEVEFLKPDGSTLGVATVKAGLVSVITLPSLMGAHVKYRESDDK